MSCADPLEGEDPLEVVDLAGPIAGPCFVLGVELDRRGVVLLEGEAKDPLEGEAKDLLEGEAEDPLDLVGLLFMAELFLAECALTAGSMTRLISLMKEGKPVTACMDKDAGLFTGPCTAARRYDLSFSLSCSKVVITVAVAVAVAAVVVVVVVVVDAAVLLTHLLLLLITFIEFTHAWDRVSPRDGRLTFARMSSSAVTDACKDAVESPE